NVLGCSGAGVLTGEAEVESDTAVAVLVVKDERLVTAPFLLDDLQALGEDAGAKLAQRSAETILTGGCVMVLPDARGLDPRGLLARFDDALGFVPLVGAVAAGTPLFELFATESAQGGLVGLAVGNAEPLVGVAQGCMPIGEPYVVTRAEENVIATIGSRPAIEMLK